MKKLAFPIALTLALAGLVHAAHSYEETASVHDIMHAVVGPNMKALSDMTKAGGPATDQDWHSARARVSVLGEAAQLLLMGSRPKADPWTPAALKLLEGSKAGTAAAKAKDAAAFKSAMGDVGGACRTCHTVYRKKK